VLLLEGFPVLGIVLEVQLSSDERKRFVWPVYAANLRARLECPVCLLVVTADEATARWAGRPIELGGGNIFTPWVLRPAGVPAITDERQAQADPELAVLSAMAHGRDADIGKSVQIALAAQSATRDLDEDRFQLYLDLILHSLSEAAREALQAMDPAKYEFQSDFARRYIALGKSEGIAEGKAALIARLLTRRFGPLPPGVHDRLATASIDELDAIGERVLTAATLQAAMDPSIDG